MLNKKIDSLYTIYTTTNIDTLKNQSRIDFYKELLKYEDISLAVSQGEKMLLKAQEYNNPEHIAESYLGLAGLYFYREDAVNIIKYTSLALPIAKEHDLTVTLGRAYSYLAQANGVSGDYEKAIANSLKAYEALKKVNNGRGMHAVLSSLSSFYIFLNETDSAEKYLLKSIEIAKEHQVQYTTSLINLAIVYGMQEKYEKAIDVYTQIFDYISEKDPNYSFILPSVYFNRGKQYYLLSQFDKAEDDYNKALTLEFRQPSLYSDLYIGLGEIAVKDLDFSLAEDYYLKALNAVKNKDLIHQELRVKEVLSKFYKSQQQFKKALVNLEDAHVLQDSIFVLESKKEIDKLTVKYEVSELEKEKELLYLKNNEQSYKLKLLYILSGVLILFFGVLVYLYFKKQKQNKILYQQTLKLVNAEEVLLRKKQKQKKESDQNSGDLNKQDSNLSESTVNLILDKLETQIEEKFYLSQDATLTELSKKVETNTKYLSQVINSEFGLNYTSFLNELRIKHLLVLLKNDKKIRNYSMTSLSEELGYKSSKTFIKAFKNYTGVSPTIYISILRKEVA